MQFALFWFFRNIAFPLPSLRNSQPARAVGETFSLSEHQRM